MLAIELNRTNFEYDVNSIVKAFYPEEQVHVLTPKMGEEKKESFRDAVRIRIELRVDGGLLWIDGESRDWAWTGGEEKEYKYAFKCFLYRALSQVTGRSLPWGSLTGIRPTKIAYGLLEQGKTAQEIVAYYMNRYDVSREKAELATAIAGRERKLLAGLSHGDRTDMPGGTDSGKQGYSQVGYSQAGYSQAGYSLYIGIPFCPTTCLYCSFTSFPIGAYRGQTDTYLDCLIRELTYVAKRYKDKILDTVYIGGGTPTTLEPEQLERLLGRLRELFDFSRVKEFTVEAGRADSITAEKLQVFSRYGVDRISVNPQTMNQRTLDYIGRKASVEDVRRAYGLARSMGFDNINMDLILGLPGETEREVRNTIESVVELAPDSLTVHSLAVKRASRLNQWIQENGIREFGQNTEEIMEIAAQGAARLGLVPYYLYRQKNMAGNFENVGYAKEGKLGLYNILIMEEVQTIIAVGAGSISKRVYPDGRIERCENVKDVALYIEKIDEMTRRKQKLLMD